jgi:hypothetical protein
VINVLFHTMKHRLQSPKGCVPSLFLKGVLLAVVVVDTDMVVVMMVMGMTNQYSGQVGAKVGPATPGTNTSLSNGVKERNESWMMNCKWCRWNDTHTSK